MLGEIDGGPDKVFSLLLFIVCGCGSVVATVVHAGHNMIHKKSSTLQDADGTPISPTTHAHLEQLKRDHAPGTRPDLFGSRMVTLVATDVQVGAQQEPCSAVAWLNTRLCPCSLACTEAVRVCPFDCIELVHLALTKHSLLFVSHVQGSTELWEWNSQVRE